MALCSTLQPFGTSWSGLENDVYRVNVMSTYNVPDAAAKLGIKKIVRASCETADGIRHTAYCIVCADTHPDPLT